MSSLAENSSCSVGSASSFGRGSGGRVSGLGDDFRGSSPGSPGFGGGLGVGLALKLESVSEASEDPPAVGLVSGTPGSPTGPPPELRAQQWGDAEAIQPSLELTCMAW
jgi:hypothetical protein